MYSNVTRLPVDPLRLDSYALNTVASNPRFASDVNVTATANARRDFLWRVPVTLRGEGDLLLAGLLVLQRLPVALGRRRVREQFESSAHYHFIGLREHRMYHAGEHPESGGDTARFVDDGLDDEVGSLFGAKCRNRIVHLSRRNHRRFHKGMLIVVKLMPLPDSSPWAQ